MEYKDKYLKYKRKYLELKRSTEGHRDAIFMLCMLKEHYVIAACIAAHSHRHYIDQLDKRVDLVVMVDENIYNKYNITLSKYFDRVIKIDLVEYPIHQRYSFATGKYSWIKYSLSKWVCLKYEEYNKILFLDVDLLPNTTSFYDLFNLTTPAFHNVHVSTDCINGASFQHNVTISYDEYITNDLDKYGSINASICLFTPSARLYDEFFKYADALYKDGMYSTTQSGPDETAMLYFYMTRDKPIYNICKDYAVIPWDEPWSLSQIAKAYNFPSYVKPWIKPKFLSWKEEVLWRDLYNKLPYKDQLNGIFKEAILENYDNYINLPPRRQKRLYNTRVVKKYPHLIKKINNSNNKFKTIMKIDSRTHFKNYGVLNRVKNSFDNITVIV